MGKILSQSGISLADAYQIEGSIVGVDTLETREVSLVHEMGATMMAERLQSFFIKMVGTASASGSWSVTSGVLPDCPNRILGASVFIPLANTGDVDWCALSIQNGLIDRELPFFTWEGSISGDNEISIKWNDDGAGVADFKMLRSAVVHTPTLATRLGVGNLMPVIRFRGVTTAFGAGTVDVTALIHVCRPNPDAPAAGQPSSHGLPLPGW